MNETNKNSTVIALDINTTEDSVPKDIRSNSYDPLCFNASNRNESTSVPIDVRSKTSIDLSDSVAQNLRNLIVRETGDETVCVKKYIRKKSSLITELVEGEEQLSVDEKRLQEALKDAGQYAYGIAAVEVWLLDDETGRLARPSSGWWTNPKLMDQRNQALSRLDDPNHPEYTDPTQIMPGVDLAGKLFAETTFGPSKKMTHRQNSSRRSMDFAKRMIRSTHDNNFAKRKIRSTHDKDFAKRKCRSTHDENFAKRKCRSAHDEGFAERKSRSTHDNRPRLKLMSTSHDNGRWNFLGKSPFAENSADPQATETPNHAVEFRDIHSLLVDPDTAKTARLGLLEEAGFVQAAGIPFQCNWHHGIVIYYTMCLADNDHTLMSIPNQVYLIHAAEVIGAVLASAESRRAIMALNLTAPNLVESQSNDNRKNNELGEDKKDSNDKEWNMKHVNHLKIWWNKCCGGDLQIPPPASWNQVGWTLIGVLSSLLLILGIAKLIKDASGDKYFLLVGPIGALMTLQYVLTSAPASQPRNVVLGPLVTGAIAMLFTYIPEKILTGWVRQAIAPAFAIAAMSKLGITHPPAGGLSIILASGKYGWDFYAISILASLASLIPAVMINNMSQKRQYPTYWGYFVKYLHTGKKPP